MTVPETPALDEPIANPIEPTSDEAGSGARRHWWLAGLLSLFFGPAGQIYNGQARKGILISLSSLVIASVAALLTLSDVSLWMPLILLLAVAATAIYLLVDAIRQARRIGTNYRLRLYNRWFVFLPLLPLIYFTPRLWLRVVNQAVKTYYIPSAAMEPTVVAGDHIFVDQLHYRSASPQRGDIVVYRSPENSLTLALKRVVAVGGDRIAILHKQVFLNGQALAEPYAVHSDRHELSSSDIAWERDQMALQTVPTGFVFLLGDNRDNSWDSRFFGPVPVSSLSGGGRMRVYWSWDAVRHATRWGRFGLFLR